MMTTKTAMALSLVLAGGCVMDDQDDVGEELGEATQDLQNVGVSTLTTSISATKSLGTATGRACFLASVEGDISIGSAQVGTAGADILNESGIYKLRVRPASAKAVCVDGAATTEKTWSTGQASVALVGSFTTHKCFLTAVTTTTTPSFASGGLKTDTDVVSITSSTGSWRLGGSTTGLVIAKARCMAVTTDFGQATVWAPAGQTAAEPGLVTDSHAACMLTQVNGHFDADSTGLSMSYAVGPGGGSDRYWTLHANNASGGARRCVN
jgi:hypothetical protein